MLALTREADAMKLLTFTLLFILLQVGAFAALFSVMSGAYLWAGFCFVCMGMIAYALEKINNLLI